MLQHDALAIDITKVAERPLHDAEIDVFLFGAAGMPEHADARNYGLLLRAGANGRKRHCAGRESKEITPSHAVHPG